MIGKDDNLEQSVSKWLASQGYPLEMRVAQAFQKHEFQVVQSDYYVDPESGDSREIDIFAYKQASIGSLFEKSTVRFAVVCECKASKEKPWVLFTSRHKRLADPARVVQRAASDVGRKLLMTIAKRKDVQDLSIFQIPDLPAYAVTQAFTTNHDICFSATTSVAKAALARTIKLDKQKRGFFSRPVFEVLFPVIVIDGKLLEAHLDEKSVVNVSQVKSGLLIWRNPLVGMPNTIINIVTLEALEKFCVDTSNSFNSLLELVKTDLKSEINDIVRGGPERLLPPGWK